MSVFLRVNSHRASDHLRKVLGRELDWHYTWATGGCLVPVTVEELAAVKAAKVKSVTRARIPKGHVPRKCWNMGRGVA